MVFDGFFVGFWFHGDWMDGVMEEEEVEERLMMIGGGGGGGFFKTLAMDN